MRILKAILRRAIPKRVLELRRVQVRTRLITESGLFDAQWYLDTNPEVKEQGMDALEHYLNFGAKERRNPGPGFNTRWYQVAYPDAAATNDDLLLHYIVFGKKEGRLPDWPKREKLSQIPEEYRKRVTRENLEKLIASCSTISFDIFDTLLTRIYPMPDDLLRQLELRLDAEFGMNSDFFALRKRAENELRDQLEPGQDVLYNHIYDRLCSALPGALVERARALDFEMECQVLRPRDAVVQCFNRAVETGKRVILTSDTYFDESQVKHFLDGNGITGYHALYISTATGLRKDTGAIWKRLLQDEKAGETSFLHIGDNELSDHRLPESMGIRTFAIYSPIEMYRYSDLAPYMAENFEDTIPLAMGPIIAARFNSPFISD